MNIKQQLKKQNLPKGSYIVTGSGILSALGIRESADIDLVVSSSVLPLFSSETSGLFEPNTDWFGKTLDDLLPNACYIDGIPYLSLKGVVEYKARLAREKDKNDLALINKFRQSSHYQHSAGGIIINDGKVLVINWTTKPYVCFPKGHIEQNETSEQAAIRELKEETGYDVRIRRKLGSWMQFIKEGEKTRCKEVDYYLLALANNNAPKPRREEREKFVNKWLTPEEAMATLSFQDSKDALAMALALNATE